MHTNTYTKTFTYTDTQNSELRTQKFIQHNSQRLNASNNANLLL